MTAVSIVLAAVRLARPATCPPLPPRVRRRSARILLVALLVTAGLLFAASASVDHEHVFTAPREVE